MTDKGIVLTDNDYQVRLEHASGIILFYKKLCPNCKAMEKMLDKFFAARAIVKNMFRLSSSRGDLLRSCNHRTLMEQ